MIVCLNACPQDSALVGSGEAEEASAAAEASGTAAGEASVAAEEEEALETGDEVALEEEEVRWHDTWHTIPTVALNSFRHWFQWSGLDLWHKS